MEQQEIAACVFTKWTHLCNHNPEEWEPYLHPCASVCPLPVSNPSGAIVFSTSDATTPFCPFRSMMWADHTASIPWCLLSFCHCDVCVISPCHCLRLWFVQTHGCAVFHWGIHHNIFIHSWVAERLGYFQFGLLITVLPWTFVDQSFGKCLFTFLLRIYLGLEYPRSYACVFWLQSMLPDNFP